MSGTKRGSDAGLSSETDNVTKKRKSQSPPGDRSDAENTDANPSSGGVASKAALKPKDGNIFVEAKPEKGATPTPMGEDDMYYELNESRQGLIIINQEFEDKDLDRKGAECDRHNLEDIYEHLDIKPEVFNNLKEHQMFARIRDFSRNIQIPCSVIFVSISTHGRDNGDLMGIGERFVNIGEIVKCFETEKLLTIPKVFLVQACKGSAEEKRECGGDSSHRDSTIPTQYCTKRADVLIAYSTTEGYVSYRHKTEGSWFIKALKDCILNPKYDNRHFVEILTICTNKIVNDYEVKDLTQTPSYYSTLRKFLKFEKEERSPKKIE